MSARDQILGGVRKSLGRIAPLSEEAAAPLKARLAGHKANLIPERTKGLDADGLVGLFSQLMQNCDATVDRVANNEAVPQAVTSYLARYNLPAEAVMSPDPVLDSIPWSSQPLLRLRRDRAQGTDAVSITPAFAAIAESGTLVMTSGAERPTTLNLLPSTHIVVLRKDQVVAASEQAWAKLRETAEARGEAMPRSVNFISGPSRTGDIESVLQIGSHGPMRLHIVVVDN
ncbi:MAG TPA: lactate utilization protein [Magnetospirillaceae bacterium]|jgi:L-lactate dehydrogenase complex protein LldG